MAHPVEISRVIRSCVAAPFVLAAILAASAAAAGGIQPRLEAHLATVPPGAQVPVIVELAAQADVHAAAAAAPGQRRARGRAVVEALRSVADRTQGPVRALIAQEEARGNARDVAPLWVINGFALSASAEAIRRIAARGDVREVRLDRKIPPPRPRAPRLRTKAAEPAWHIETIRAPEVWALDPRYDGTGVVVGSFDTGVDGTHPELAAHYRGDDSISWFDPYHQHRTPYDGIGHGTHTVGTMVGGDLSGYMIGVAPGAKWIAAKGWNNNDDGTASAFHEIFQWFLAPGGDPANAPQVVNHSWGMDTFDCDGEFVADVAAFRAAGIVPVFAAGNYGPDEGTVLPPGNYAGSFTVGSTDYVDDLSLFSSQGPSACDGGTKPDISAPGETILSTWPGGDYAYLDGTSMATPQVTGAAAVLLSIRPSLTVDEIETFLAAGAVDRGPPGADNGFGAGRLDVAESARIAIESDGRPLVGITASTPTAREAGLVPGGFTVRRTGATDAPLSVSYTVSGTATPGSDYVALPGTLVIPSGASSAILAVTPIDDAEVELDETVVVQLTDDPAYFPAPAQATVTIVSDEIPPDLVVATLTAPASAGAGAAITINDTTKNQGTVAAGASRTRFYLCASAAIDAASVFLAARDVPALAAGGSHSGSVSATMPVGTTPGYYWIVAKADGDDALIEAQEGNNTKAAFVAIGPDLVISSVTVPSDVGAGAAISVSDTTKNQGGGAAAASTTRFYLSSDLTVDAGDVLLGSRAVAPLPPGASDAGPATLTIPASTPTGIYYLIARADGDDALAETIETNNTQSRTLRVGPDLAVSAFTTPVTAGAGASITVTDTTRNQGGGAAPASTTRFYLSIDYAVDAGDWLAGGRAVPALAAGASDTASTVLVIPDSIATGTYYLIARADGADAVAETNEANNTQVRSLRVGPDLAVTALTLPVDIGAGTTIDATATTANQGGGTAAASTTTFYLSRDTTLDAGDAPLGSRAVPPLAAGASDSAPVTLTIPASTAAGTYYLIARADAGDAVAETIETNNIALHTLRVGPDLTVAALTVPGSAGAGLPISVTDTTKNQGGGTAAASTTTFYLSRDTTLDAGDALLGSRAVAPLAAGASDSASVALTIPATTAAGIYYLIARADAGDVVAETIETNNTAARTLFIGADLVVAALTVPSTASPGTTIGVTDTTKNQGAGAAPASTTRFYLSSDSVLDAADMVLGARAVPALAPAAADTASTSLAIPAGLASATYYVIAVADADALVPETQEANNRLARAITIGPDLVISSLTAPSDAGAGAAIAVSDTTRNQGGGTAPASTTRFYLSADVTFDAGDVVLGSRAVAALAAGASDSASTMLTIPASTAAGSYYLIARADGTDAVAETIEANNTLPRILRVGPDLAVTVFTTPATGEGGSSISVTDTTKNQGGGGAGASTTMFYLSADAVIDAGDALLGSRPVAALAAGSSDSASTTLTLPASVATGTYYLIARADGGDAVPEATETNNIALRTLRVGPDLTVATLTVPGTAAAGAAIGVTDSTKNQGGGMAAASTTTFHLSRDTTLDAGDALLGSRAVAPLAAGASDSASVTLTIPASTAAGIYYLIARADAGDVVTETIETNNTATRTLLIGPDLVVATLSVPSSTTVGATISVTDTTRNQGAAAAPASTTRFYLSTDNVLSAGDLPLGDRAVPALATGAADSAGTLLPIPAGTAAGVYYFIAVADDGHVVDELYETNNILVRTLQIAP